MVWRSELPMMNIINMTLKNKSITLKNLIEMRYITLNDLKFDIKKNIRHPVKVRPVNSKSFINFVSFLENVFFSMTFSTANDTN